MQFSEDHSGPKISVLCKKSMAFTRITTYWIADVTHLYCAFIIIGLSQGTGQTEPKA